MPECQHAELQTKIRITHLADVGRHIVELALRCKVCQVQFQFLGMNRGEIALDGVCASQDGGIAKLSIMPMGAILPALDEVRIPIDGGTGPGLLPPPIPGEDGQGPQIWEID